MSYNWVYVLIIAYFIVKLKNCFSSAKDDVVNVFSFDLLKLIFSIVVLNIFLSYGLLYLSDFMLSVFSGLNFPSDFLAFNSIVGGLVSIIIISPISEELIFRGVFLNRIRLVVPTVFAILISSILFASLHSYGSIVSAFVFSVCMAILYLKTDNIFVAIFAHFLNNLIAEVIVILDADNVLFSSSLVMEAMSVLSVISAVFVFLYIFHELKILNNKKIK